MAVQKLLEARGHAHIDAVVEGNALAFHLRHAAVDVVLLHLEVGNAVAQKAAGLGLALIDMHVMAGAASCWAAARPAGPEPITATRLPVRTSAGSGLIQPIFQAFVGDGLFDGLDGDRMSSRFSVQASSHGAGRRGR